MRRRWKIALTVIAVLVALPVVAVGGKLAVLAYERDKVIRSHAISETRDYTLGGVPQTVMVDGADEDAPLVVFFHGGPGSPIPFNVGSRGMLPEVTSENILVTWDQYGSGINNAEIDESVTVDTLVGMAIDLLEQLKRDFPDNRLTVFGVSWGSLLAARAAAERPDLIDEVVVYGQITHGLFVNDESLDALAAADLPDDERARVAELQAKDTYTVDDAEFVSNLVAQRTEGVFAKGSGLTDYLDDALGWLTSPDYSLADVKAITNNGYTGKTHLIEELMITDLRPLLNEVTVPYYICQGDKDLTTSTAEVQKLYDDSSNPNLHLEVMPASSHFPSKEALAYVLDFDNFRR